MEKDAYKSLLARLDPMSMMEENGLKRAHIAMGVLRQKASSEDTCAATIAAVGDGVKVLLQTALLHPEPALREGAAAVLAACVAQNNRTFLDASLDRGPASLPAALVRMCAEQDRAVKPADATEDDDGDRPAAVDPDLPARKCAVGCLQSLLLRADVAVGIRS